MSTASENYPVIESLIKDLDVRTPQVLIETLIAEVKLTEVSQFGIEYKWFDDTALSGYPTNRTGRVNFNLQDWTVPKAGAEGAAGDLLGMNYWLMRTDKDVGMFLNMLSARTDVNVISRPNIVVSNNQEARITVGDTIPILKESQITTTGGITRSYEYKDVATELIVKPQISANRDVLLEIKQTINEVGEFNVTLEAFSFTKRETETTMVTRDGQTVILGGMIKERQEYAESKIPILGDLPIIGALFKRRSVNPSGSPTKLELMVFITPHVIMTPREADEVTRAREDSVDEAITPRRLESRKSYERARKHHEEREWALAIEGYEKAVELDPDAKSAERFLGPAIESEVGRLYGAAEVYLRGGRYAEAIHAWEKILSYDPGQVEARAYIDRTVAKIQQLQSRKR